MGITGLYKILEMHAPSSIKQISISECEGWVVAIDASVFMYQFLTSLQEYSGSKLTDNEGETTSHISGVFYRTLKLMKNGIRPVYVFDGRSPEIKREELEKRRERIENAFTQIRVMQESGVCEEYERHMTKLTKRTVRITSRHVEECKELLKLMGVPFVESPEEAEAQCAQITKTGFANAVMSEDMDTLAFGSPILVRNISSLFKNGKATRIDLKVALKSLGFQMDQFIDFCILLGCDFCKSIKGVGPKRALEMVKKFGSIDEITKNINRTKFGVPDEWNYVEARQVFANPLVNHEVCPKWGDIDTEGLVRYLVKKGFAEKKLRTEIEKVGKMKKRPAFMRLDAFFQRKHPNK